MRGLHQSEANDPASGRTAAPASALHGANAARTASAVAATTTGAAPRARPEGAENVSDEELALHLAGGTLLDWNELCSHFGAASGWLARAEPEWIGAKPAESRLKRVRDFARQGHVEQELRGCA